MDDRERRPGPAAGPAFAAAACVSGVIAAAASLAAYAADPSAVPLAAFAASACVFGATILHGRLGRLAREALARAGRAGASAARTARGVRTMGAVLLRRAMGSGRARVPPVRTRSMPVSGGARFPILGHAKRLSGPVADADVLKRAYGRLNQDMARLISMSGAATDLRELRREAGTVLIALSAAAALASLWIAMTAGHVGLIMAALSAPAFALFYPRIKLRLAASERKAALTDEVVFFAVYCLLLAGVGRTMIQALAGAAASGVFGALEREARVMARGRVLGMGGMAALADLGRNHPNRAFCDLVCGYVSAFGAGDPESHLRSQSADLLDGMRRRLDQCRERSAALATMVVFVLVFVPVMIMPVAFVAGEQSASFLTGVALAGMPLLALSVCVAAQTFQPKFGNDARIGWRIPAALAAGAGVLAAVSGMDEAWSVLLAASITFSASVVVMTRAQRRNADAVDRSIGAFFRDITGRVSAGDPSISHAISGIVRDGQRQYARAFMTMIVHAHSRIKRAEETIENVLADTVRGSWLGRFSFFLLSKLADTGAADAWVLTRTTEFVEKFSAAKRDMISSIRPYMLAAPAAPAAVVAMTWFLKWMLAGGDSAVPEALGTSIGLGFVRANATPAFESAVNMLTAVSAVCAGVAVGKISSLTIMDMRPLLAGSVVALVAIVAASLAG